MTVAETVLWRALRNRGLKAKFRRQVPIGPFVTDFACVAVRLVVELDGRPHDDPERRQRDAERDLWFAEQGWRVLRLPNDLVLGGGDVLGRVEEVLRVPSSGPSLTRRLPSLAPPGEWVTPVSCARCRSARHRG